MDTEKNWENIVNEAIGLEPIEIKSRNYLKMLLFLSMRLTEM